LQKHVEDEHITELKDPRYPLRFRYTRNGGSWFYVRGGKWKKIGNWPLVKFATVIKKLPLIEINLASGIDEETAHSDFMETVGDVLDWHLVRVMDLGTLSPRRIATIKTAVNTYLKPRIGQDFLCDVSKHFVDEKLIRGMRKARYSAATIKLAFEVFKKAFSRAAEMKLIDKDPTESMKFSDFIEEAIKPKPAKISPRELASVLDTIMQTKSDNGRMLAAFMALHGTRIGETLRLRWDWIDFEAKTILIPAEVTKSTRSLLLPLPELTARLLREHRAKQAKRGYRGVYVFVGRFNRPIDDNKASKLIRQVSGRAWTSHDLRKAFRGLLGVLGVEYLTAERLVNHSLTTLEKTYDQEIDLIRKADATNKAHNWILERVSHF